MPTPHHRRRLARLSAALAMVLAASLAGSGGEPPQAHAAPPPTDTATPARTGATENVTLITGDRLAVTRQADGRYAASPLSSRTANGAPVTFQTLATPEGDLYVTPSDAGGLIAAGLVDYELFNVRRLVEDGRTDRQSTGLPVIVQFAGATARSASPAKLAATADALPATNNVRALESIGGAGVALAKSQVSGFWSAVAGAARRTNGVAPGLGGGVAKIWLSRRVHVTLDVSVPQIGAPQAWQAGYDGTGVKVAVLDTGIDANHPDVADRIDTTRSFVPNETVADGHGHGTHVAATVAGSGAASGGSRKGVAPGARLVVGKVLNNGGYGEDTWIIDGMEWAAASGAKVISMSLGSDVPQDETNPMSQAVDRITAQTGVLFVIAAGNAGPSARTIGAPGSAPSALTVGAVDKNDAMAAFSSRGPVIGSNRLKPDITAPGVGIVAARAAGTSMGSPVDDHYTSAGGTSMATPHVAGAAAILAQRYPDWKAADIKGALTGSARPRDGATVYDQGTGRVDVPKALAQRLVATPSNVEFTTADDATEPVTRTVTVANHGDTAATVDVSALVNDMTGKPVPGKVTVEPATLTVPAGGSAPLTVTFHPAVGGAGGFSGVLRAVVGDTEVLRLAIGAQQQEPSRNVRLTLVPPPGWPMPDVLWEFAAWTIVRIDAPQPVINVARGVPHTDVALPEGVYMAVTEFTSNDPRTGDRTITVVADPEVVVGTEDQEVVIDAGTAKPVRIDTPRPSEIYAVHQKLVRGTTFEQRYEAAWVTASSGDRGRMQMKVVPTRPVKVGAAHGYTAATLAEPLVRLDVAGRDAPAVRPFYLNSYLQEPKLDVTRKVELVDVGGGSATEVDAVDLRGRLALVSRPYDRRAVNETGSAYAEILPRLRAAGALAAVLTHEVAVPLWCSPPLYNNDRQQLCPAQQVALPVMRVGPAEGADLRAAAAARPATVTLTARSRESYLYHLRFDEPGGFGDVSYRVGTTQLAATEQRFHSTNGIDMHHYAHSLDASGVDMGWMSYPVLAPSTVTTYQGPVSPQLGWNFGVTGYRVSDRDNQEPWLVLPTVDVRGVWRTTPRAGRQPHIAWNTPFTVGAHRMPPELAGGPLTHWLGLGKNPAFYRDDELLRMWPSATHNGGDDIGTWLAFAGADPEIVQAHLYRDGKEIIGLGGYPVAFPLTDPASARYRYTHRFITPWDDGPREILSTWDFTSHAPAKDETSPRVPCYEQEQLPADQRRCRIEPMLMVGYDLAPAVGLDNAAHGPGMVTVGVNVYHQYGAANSALRSVKIQVSYDRGKHWLPTLALRKADGEYHVMYAHPPSRDGATVSLRVEASDQAGNRVEQTLLDAYALKQR